MTIEELRQLAKGVDAALREILERIDFGSRGGRTTVKGSKGDLVTDLDELLEREIRKYLEKLLPGAGIVGEESGGDISLRPTWIVDPIDGTTNIVHGVPHAAVTVALCDHRRPRLGIVKHIFSPASYLGIEGGGAVKTINGRNQRLKVSTTDRLSAALVSFGLPYDRDNTDTIFAAAKRVFRESQDLRRGGSAALDIVGVAEGILDAHFEVDLRAWDVVAAGVILREAGGKLTTWDGRSIKWRGRATKAAVAASNGVLHGALLSALSADRGAGQSG